MGGFLSIGSLSGFADSGHRPNGCNGALAAIPGRSEPLPDGGNQDHPSRRIEALHGADLRRNRNRERDGRARAAHGQRPRAPADGDRELQRDSRKPDRGRIVIQAYVPVPKLPECPYAAIPGELPVVESRAIRTVGWHKPTSHYLSA